MEFVKTYFECFKESGMNTFFEIHQMVGEEKWAAHAFDHCIHDGVSAMLELARLYPEEGFEPPKLSVDARPSLWRRLLELAKWYARFYPFKPVRWKVFSNQTKEMVSASILVEDWNYVHRQSLNIRLLASLDQVSREYLEDTDGNTHWMTPVGLYDGIQRSLPPANRVSFIDLKVRPQTTLEELQDQSKQQLSELNYWGTLLTMRFSVLCGKKPFVLFIKVLHFFFRRTGTFSNLGAWNIPGIPADEWWVFGKGCVAEMSPVDAMALVVNGKLGLSIHIHPSLGWSEEMVREFAGKWKDVYLSMGPKENL